jgi:Zn-dependent protease
MKLWAGSYFGVPLYLHWSWFIFMLIMFAWGGTYYAFIVLSMFIFVVFHEYGHIIAAKYFKAPVKDVTLYPIGGIARLKFKPNRPKEEFWIAIAGPAVNFVFALVFFLAFEFYKMWLQTLPEITEQHKFYFGLVFILMLVNLTIGVFNLLIPVIPMDGGRVLRSLLNGFTGNYLWSTLVSARVGQVICVFAVGLGIYLLNPILILIFLFMAVAAQAELILAEESFMLQTIKNRIADRLGNPALADQEMSQIIDALQDTKDDQVKKDLMLDELIPLLQDIEGRHKKLMD